MSDVLGRVEMNAKVLFIISVVCVVLVGCSFSNPSSDKIMNLEIGSSRMEVMQTLGNPRGRSRNGEAEVLRYLLCIENCWNPGRQTNGNYFITVINNKVVSIDEAEVIAPPPRPGFVYTPPQQKQQLQSQPQRPPAMGWQQPTKTNCRAQYDGSMECTTQQGGGLANPGAFQVLP